MDASPHYVHGAADMTASDGFSPEERRSKVQVSGRRVMCGVLSPPSELLLTQSSSSVMGGDHG